MQVGRLRQSITGGVSTDSYRLLADVYHQFLSEHSLSALLEKIADALSDLLAYDTLTIYEADESERILTPVLARDAFADEIMGSTLTFGSGITGWAVQNRQPVLANEAHTDPRVRFVPGTPIEPEALISVPLIARGHVKGALNIYRQNGKSFSHDEFRLVKVFSEAAALAIDNADVRRALEHQAQTDPLTGLYNHRFFHERLRSEVSRASRAHDSVALLMFDIDDFKKLNDVFGHGLGDHVLTSLAEVLKNTVRIHDVVCRIGGEEFAVIMPSCDSGAALGLARRLRDRLAVLEFPPAGTVTVSIGIAQGPEDAMNPRELVACAESAMMAAKARGKDRSVLYEGDALERPLSERGPQHDVRSIAHLKMLQSLAGKLNRLTDVRQIAETIADELRTLTDYHSCRVYMAEGKDLIPIAIKGDMEVYGISSPDLLNAKVGEGVTGRAAETGRSLLIPNALECDFAVQVPGTDEVDESLLCVPMMYGSRVNGVITISKLGINQFDGDDQRLLEVLSGQASVALENARLYDAQRREAENANALLRFADELSNTFNVYEVANLAVGEMTKLMGVPQASLWLQTDDGNFKCAAHAGYGREPGALRFIRRTIEAPEATELLAGGREPFVMTPDEMRSRFADLPDGPLRTVAVAPLGNEVGTGWLVARQGIAETPYFTEEKLRLMAGIAYQVTVAIQKASLYKDQKETADIASALLELSRELSSAETLDEILDRVVEQAARILGSPRTWVWLEDPAQGKIVPAAWWGVEKEQLDRVLEMNIPTEVAEAVYEGTTEPFVLQPHDYAHLLDNGAQDDDLAHAIAPMRVDGRFGCIVVAAPALGEYRFSDRKIRLLAGLADQAKLALTNVSNFEVLETTFLSTIEALANALEAKDEYTSNHTRSIVDMSLRVGADMGLDALGLKNLEMGALFHDIGKIGIPSDLLRKEGPLTPEERAVMNQHPELGEKILAPIERLAGVRPIVRACHEHFDGGGYPDGLRGDQIPIQSRIILVCDAYDAMTSDRPYRTALSHDEAVRRLHESAGGQFDPEVVAVFLKILEDEDCPLRRV